MVVNNVKDALAIFFDIFRIYIKSMFLLVLVIVDLLSGTKLCNRLKSAATFGASFLIFTSIAILIGKDSAERQDMGLLVHDFCHKYGYKIEDETLTTEDGYILTMHRMRCAKNHSSCNEENRRPPVLLMHGILGSSADYLAAGPIKSLAFQLVNNGYDVWLGNQRGNTFSREHIMLDADTDSLFWDFRFLYIDVEHGLCELNFWSFAIELEKLIFSEPDLRFLIVYPLGSNCHFFLAFHIAPQIRSFHEIGTLDIPAMIDHIIAKTKFSKIFYVGRSLGSLDYIVMTTTKPEYNDKILLSSLMAPVVSFYKARNILFRVWSSFNFVIEPIINIIGPKEFGGYNQLGTRLARYICIGPHLIGNWLCTDGFIKHAFGFSDQLNYEILPFYLSNYPAGGSLKELQHLAQNKHKEKLTQYDYYNKNEELYNQETPPIYDLSKSIAPVAVYYGRGDIFVNVETLYLGLKSMKNVVLKYKVPYAQFNHLDFIVAKDIDTLLNNKIIEMINKYNKRR